MITIATGFTDPDGIAADVAGHLFVADNSLTALREITPTGGYFIQPALPAGLVLEYFYSGNVQGNPSVVSPATNYTVTAYNIGGSGTATLNLKVAPNVNLNGIIPSKGTLSPQFTAANTSYTDMVTNGTSSVTLTPFINDATSTASINGSTVASGTASGPIALTVGSNPIPIIVAAGDGVTTQTYTVTVNRAPPSSNAALSGITLSKGTLSPVFAAATTSYTNMVTNGTTSVTLTPTVADATATVTVNGTAVASGGASAPITLVVGNNNIPVIVTAQDGVTKQTYTVNVIRPSTNARLSALTVSAGTLTPAFNTNTTSYTEAVGNATSSISITPTVTVTGATVTVNGAPVTSGNPSAAVALNVGVNTITTVVTAQDGITTDTYTLTVTRQAAGNAGLANLSLSHGALSPAFTTATTSYTDVVTNGTSSVTLTATLADATATLTVNGISTASGAASGPIALIVGNNNITTLVTAQDGTTQNTYTVNVIRPSTNAKLSALTISTGILTPAFNTITTSYTASVNTSSIIITPTAAVTGSTIKVNGTSVVSGAPSAAIALSPGANTITTIVTAQDGVTTDTYTITVTSTVSANANLAGLTLSKGTLSPAFATATTSYTNMVTNGTTSVTLTPTLSDATATVTVNGTTVKSGSPSGAIALSVGANTITTIVTAQDGTTKNTYTVNVIRPSTNAKLSALTISSGTLTPAFNTNTTSYTASVTNATSSITLTPTVAVTGATVTVNGTTMISGAPSAAIALSVGGNTITTVVTAQDGITTDTYTTTVTRAAAGENIPDAEISVQTPTDKPLFDDDVLIVHQGLSPNGDGVNDFLVIDGILAYPYNKISIMNRNGQLVYEAKGYDNSTKPFDGHSNKNGQMQLPGTYFYSLDYTMNGVVKHKTGFIILKY